jgi:hypothetical protein
MTFISSAVMLSTVFSPSSKISSGHSVHIHTHFEMLKDLIVELEKVFDDFCVTTEEYELLVSDEKFVEHRVVNGDDLKMYKMNVTQTYQEAREVYTRVKWDKDK